MSDDHVSDAREMTGNTAAAVVRDLGLGRGRLRGSQLAEMARVIAEHDDLWRPVVRHDSEQRWYARLHYAPNVEVWLIGWETGQDTRFHDHGGSSGAFYVAQGRLTEEYGNVEGRSGLRRRTHRSGRVVPFGPAYVHNLGNADAEPATSIHAYSPPLATMTYYQQDGGMLIPYETLVATVPDPAAARVGA